MRTAIALVPNKVGVAPGQRTNIELFAAKLPAYGWTVELLAFEDDRLHDVLYQPGRAPQKVAGLARCYWQQFRRVRSLPPCDLIVVYREAAMVGPAWLERIAARAEVPLVYDLDDPLFVPYRSPTSGWFSMLKFPKKVHTLFRRADHVIANSAAIGEYASRFNPAVTVVPMLVDVDRFVPPASRSDDAVRLVWIGSHTTMPNLETIAPALARLCQERDVTTRVIGAGDVSLPDVKTDLRQWSAATEVADLQECHIGLVPLTDLAWNHWKFFYKALQYMAVGMPVVARRMGSNAEVIEDGVNGFLVETQDDWVDRIRTLVDDPELRARMGEAGRQTVVERYSVQGQVPRLAQVLDEVVDSRSARSARSAGPAGPAGGAGRRGAGQPVGGVKSTLRRRGKASSSA